MPSLLAIRAKVRWVKIGNLLIRVWITALLLIDELHRHNQNPVGANGYSPLLWSTVQEKCCKTPPLQQWAVGREFCLRAKSAFDRKSISIGVPQRSLSVQNFSDFTNKKQNGKDNPQYSSVN